jgi:hypothetical protein
MARVWAGTSSAECVGEVAASGGSQAVAGIVVCRQSLRRLWAALVSRHSDRAAAPPRRRKRSMRRLNAESSRRGRLRRAARRSRYPHTGPVVRVISAGAQSLLLSSRERRPPVERLADGCRFRGGQRSPPALPLHVSSVSELARGGGAQSRNAEIAALSLRAATVWQAFVGDEPTEERYESSPTAIASISIRQPG